MSFIRRVVDRFRRAALGIDDRRAVTVVGVAALAGVDRSYIYDHPDLLEQIRQQRNTTPVTLAPRPAAERSTLASLQARLTSAHEEITRLKAVNRKLRDRLAVTLGDARLMRAGMLASPLAPAANARSNGPRPD